jgi:UPF0716 family protein affecting phage T7 exclusion
MMILALGVLSLVSGALLLFVPQRLVKMSQAVNHAVVSVDKQVSKYHIGVGICLILASIFLFTYGYYIGWR